MQKYDNTSWLGIYLSGKMSGQGSLYQGSAQLENFLVGEVSVWVVSVGDLSSGKCQSGNCLVRKLSYNHFNDYFDTKVWPFERVRYTIITENEYGLLELQWKDLPYFREKVLAMSEK